MTKGKESIIQKLIVAQTKDGYRHEATSQTWMRGSQLQDVWNEFQIESSKIDGCLRKVVLVSLKKRSPHVDQTLQIGAYAGEGTCTIQWKHFAGHTRRLKAISP